MSLYKQTNSDIWWASISVPGHPRIRRSTGETARPAAQDVHDAIRTSLRQVDPALKGETWGKAVLKWCAAADRSDSEIHSLGKFAKFFPDRKLTDVTVDAIDKALSFCHTASTYTRYRTMIAAILTLSGVKLKLTKRKGKKPKPRDWITSEQWGVLRDLLPRHLLPPAAFAINTGLRQANVLNLTWSKVDLARKMVWVDAQDTKAGEAIAVPLNTGAVNALISVQGQHPEFCFTFRGQPFTEINRAWKKANHRAGTGVLVETKDLSTGKRTSRYTGFTWHGLRHTWATWHVQSGTPLDVLQKLGAWEDPRMVQNYAHHSPGYLAGFADNITKEES